MELSETKPPGIGSVCYHMKQSHETFSLPLKNAHMTSLVQTWIILSNSDIFQTTQYCWKKTTNITSKTPFGRWTSRSEQTCLKCVQLHVRSCGYPPAFVKRIASGPLVTHQVSAQSFQPFPRYEKGVCTCSCVPPLTFVTAWLMGL